MLKDATRDGLRSVSNVINDKGYVPGGGACEVYLHCELMKRLSEVNGKRKLGYRAFAESLLVVPKALAQNSGYDVQESVLMLIDSYNKNGKPVGLDL